MSEATPTSVPPPGAEELAEAGVPDGGLVADTSAEALPPVSATATRGKRLGALFKNVWVLGITWVIAIAALIAGATYVDSIAIGGGAALAVLLLALLIVFLIASSQAANDFFAAYAKSRGLSRVAEKGSLPPVTPLLRRGDRRYTDEIFNGQLPGGLSGSLAHYTFEETSTDSNGNRDTTYYHYTVALSQLPETAPFLSELALQRRAGFRFLDGAEDVFRSRQRVEVESELADRKFEIFTGKNDEMVKARQVFTPTFLVWLGEEAHKGIAFELVAGAYVANIKGHLKTAEELDNFCKDAAVIARRLDEEACE
jgi:hypothetical protein